MAVGSENFKRLYIEKTLIISLFLVSTQYYLSKSSTLNKLIRVSLTNANHVLGKNSLLWILHYEWQSKIGLFVGVGWLNVPIRGIHRVPFR